MTITQKYVKFILNYLGDTTKVRLMEPKKENPNSFSMFFQPIQIPVQIKVLEIYTRSAKLSLIFDKYEVNHIFFMPMNSSPESIIGKTHHKISQIVNNTYIEDGREEEIKHIYSDKRRNFKIEFKTNE